MDLVLKYLPVVLGGIALIAWGVRLEAKANNATTKEEHATTVQKIDDMKDSVQRIEGKVDRLLERQ